MGIVATPDSASTTVESTTKSESEHAAVYSQLELSMATLITRFGRDHYQLSTKVLKSGDLGPMSLGDENLSFEILGKETVRGNVHLLRNHIPNTARIVGYEWVNRSDGFEQSPLISVPFVEKGAGRDSLKFTSVVMPKASFDVMLVMLQIDPESLPGLK
ncbi:MAG: hypothetical protein WCO33_00430 [bacterium]